MSNITSPARSVSRRNDCDSLQFHLELPETSDPPIDSLDAAAWTDSAAKFAVHWQDVARILPEGLRPDDVKARLPSGSTPLEHSVKMVEMAAHRKLPVLDFVAALQAAGLAAYVPDDLLHIGSSTHTTAASRESPSDSPTADVGFRARTPLSDSPDTPLASLSDSAVPSGSPSSASPRRPSTLLGFRFTPSRYIYRHQEGTIRKAFASPPKSEIRTKLCSVHGRDGSGKSWIVENLLRNPVHQYKYHIVLNAKSETSVQQSFIEWAQREKLLLEKEKASAKDVCLRLVDLLERSGSLLVFDRVGAADLPHSEPLWIRQYIPEYGNHVVLIASGWDSFWSATNVDVPVDKMEPSEGLLLLAGFYMDVSDAQRVGERLQWFPAALRGAAVYMANNHLDCTALLEHMSTTKVHPFEIEQLSLQAWYETVKQVKAERKLAYRILVACLLLASEHIPRRVLSRFVQLHCKEEGHRLGCYRCRDAKTAVCEADVDECIVLLVRLHFLSEQTKRCDGRAGLSMSMVIQQQLLRHIPAAELYQHLNHVGEALNAEFPNQDTEEGMFIWFRLQNSLDLLPHIEQVLWHYSQPNDFKTVQPQAHQTWIPRLLWYRSMLHHAYNQFELSLEYAQEFLTVTRTSFRTNLFLLSQAYHEVAVCVVYCLFYKCTMRNFDPGLARACIDEAIKIRQSEEFKSHPFATEYLAGSLAAFGTVIAITTSQWQLAIDIFDKSLFHLRHSPDCPFLVRIFECMSVVYERQLNSSRQYNSLIEMERAAKNIFGEGDPQHARAAFRLGCCSAAGLEAQRVKLNYCLSVYLKHWGEHHLQTALAHDELGSVLMQCAEWHLAEPHLESAVEIASKAVYLPCLLPALCKLAVVQWQCGRDEHRWRNSILHAQRLCDEMRSKRTTCCEEHSDALLQVGWAYELLGLQDDALRTYSSAANCSIALHGEPRAKELEAIRHAENMYRLDGTESSSRPAVSFWRRLLGRLKRSR